LYKKQLVYKRKLAEDGRGHFRLSLPSELADFLGLNKGGDLAIVLDPESGGLVLRAWAEDRQCGVRQ
jgi:bifunctional DNA-binding transcriptional regulator/antitoxin component of YhaV-PrlF toxin-antitoxin module